MPQSGLRRELETPRMYVRYTRERPPEPGF